MKARTIRLYRYILSLSGWLATLEDVSSAWTDMTGKDKVLRVIGGLRLGKVLLDKTLNADNGPAGLMRRLGYLPVFLPPGVSATIVSWLTAQCGYQDMRVAEGKLLRVWGEDICCLVTLEGALLSGPYVRDGNKDLLYIWASKAFWAIGDAVVLEPAKAPVFSFDDDDSGGGSFWHAHKAPGRGDYVGDPDPKVVADRLRAHGSSNARSVLIIGPSGSGKTTLARLVAEHMGGRTIIANPYKLGSPRRMGSGGMNLSGVLELIMMLMPSVVVLNDVDMEDSEGLLDLLESAHGKTTMILTFMADDINWATTGLLEGKKGATGKRKKGKEKPGMMTGRFYYSGMRPGRVDEIILLPPPGDVEREVVLRHYSRVFNVDLPPMKDLVPATAGLTPAYLREVVDRIARFGLSTWKGEVETVRLTAPRAGYWREGDDAYMSLQDDYKRLATAVEDQRLTMDETRQLLSLAELPSEDRLKLANLLDDIKAVAKLGTEMDRRERT